jgi:hypothetical protein
MYREIVVMVVEQWEALGKIKDTSSVFLKEQ